MKNAPASLYTFGDEYDSDELLQQLEGYEAGESHQEVDERLITTIDEVRPTDRGLAFDIEYDYVLPIDVRDQEEPRYIKTTKKTPVRFCEDVMSSGFVLSGSEHGMAAGRVSEAITGSAESYDKVSISETTIAKIVNRDSVDAKYKIWEDIDVFTDMASIKGKIEDSSYSQQFDDYGRPVWVMFDSGSIGRTVGISDTGIVLYGSDVSPAEAENYYYDVVLPEIESSD
jgi:hypothetical protein